jgi:hypothetical protein
VPSTSATAKMIKLAKMSEAALQTHLCKLLYAFGRPDILWFSVPNGEQRSAKTGQRLKQQGVRAGAADLCFVIDGRFVGLELKTETGRISIAQEAFKDDVERAGGRYCCAYGLNEAIAALIDIGAFRPNIHINLPTLKGEV